ncbi:hypothetical protein [Mycolicibacterium brumae]|nr:hypothetical protein [Mycolicibacterium brumae]MCV7192199.1 hypothetical protein [Mycolicibacterium brumae]UWW07024.1 hypothetical protein L2Z93_000009 [Mycolicibacterium brumae]
MKLLQRVFIVVTVAAAAAIAWSRFRGEVWHTVGEHTESPAPRRVEGP